MFIVLIWVSDVYDLLSSIKLFRLQGFETPEEMFLLGYLMAHGGERHILSIIEHDLKLIEHNAEFWFPHIKEDFETILKRANIEEIKNAETLLLEQLKTRNAKVPEWLQKEIQKIAH